MPSGPRLPLLLGSDLVAASMMDSGLCARESYAGFAFAGFSANLTSPVAVGKQALVDSCSANQLDSVDSGFQQGGKSQSRTLTLSATEVVGIHASTLILFAWVGIPLLRFHPHPSQRRSIGQTIGVTACSPQRAAIFKTPTASRCASKPQSIQETACQRIL